jgi:hypothetical protein
MTGLVQWLVAVPLLILSVLTIVGNVTTVIQRVSAERHGKSGPSWIPFVGGIAGALGLLMLPIKGVSGYWWIPLLVDWGCVPGFTHTAIYYVVCYWRKRREDQSNK